MSETELNQRLADQIRRTNSANGQQYQPGDWLALLDGRVVAVARDVGGALRLLRVLDPDPQRGMLVAAGAVPVDVIR